MDDKNQNTSVVFPDDTNVSEGQPLSFSNVPRDLSYPRSLVSDPGISQPPNQVENNDGSTVLSRLAKRADIILAILLVLGSLGLVWGLSRSPDTEDSNIANQFETPDIPLAELSVDGGITLGSQKVTINGALVVTPSAQPTSATAGQIYYDETSNVLAYYNGTQFVPVGGVTSIQGQTGPVTLSGAGGITVTDDGAGNITLTGPGASAAGVTSLNGLAGGLTVTNASAAGSTITIDDASTSAKGIASFNAANFTVTGGAVNTVQDIGTGATPTFAGLNTNTIQGSGGLSLLSGGNVTIGTSNTTGTLLVVDTKTSAGDPTGVDGAIYYNSNSGNFRCYQGGVWTNCITASGGFVSLQNAYDNSTPAVVNLNATNDGILVRDTAGGIGGNLFAVQNSDGSATYLGVTTAGLASSGNATLQGGAITLGTTGQQGSLVLHDGNGQTTTVQAGDSAGDLALILPTNAGSNTQCLKQGPVATQLIWDACDGGSGGTSTDLQDAYENGNTITATNAEGDVAFTLSEATNFLTNITGSGRFAVQGGGTDIMSVAPSAVTLGSGVDIIMQGAGAYITNPQAQANSEAFGLNASVSSNSVAVGNGASGGASGVAIGQGSTSGGNAVTIGQGAGTNSASVAIGQGATANFTDSIAIGRQATTTASNQLVIGDSQSGTNYINNVFIGNGVTAASPQAVTYNATGGNGTDIAGAALNLAGGRGTGNAAGGVINLQVSAAGASGATLNSLSTVGTFASTGLTFGNATLNTPITLQSGTGAITIGSGNQARTIDIGNVDADQTINIGQWNTTATQIVQVGALGTSSRTIIYGGQGSVGQGGIEFDSPNVLIRSASWGDSTDVLRVQNAAGNNIFQVDTSDPAVRIMGTGSFGSGGRAYFGSIGDNAVAFGESGAGDSDAAMINGRNGLDIYTGDVDGSSDLVAVWSGTGELTLQNSANSSSAFQVQDVAGSGLLTVDTTARSVSGGNLVKIGNSTGTDGDLTLFQLDAATADPTSNLSALNGGLFYNSTTNKVSLIENGQVKVVCNTTDLGCGTGGGVTTVGTIDTQTKSSNGAVISGSSIYLQTADGTNPGLVSTGSQTIAGAKTLTGAATFQNSADSSSAFRVLRQGGTALFTVNTSATNTGIYVAGSGTGGGGSRVYFGPTGDTGVWIGESGTTNTNVLAMNGDSGLEFYTSGSHLWQAVEYNGVTSWQLSDTNGAEAAYVFENASDQAVVWIDAANGELNLGQSFAISGAIRFYDDGGSDERTLAYSSTNSRLELAGTNGNLFIEDKLGLGAQALTPSGAFTITPAASYITTNCSNGGGCAATMGETSAQDGDLATIVNTGTNTVSFSDTGGVSELSAAHSLGQWDTLTLIYVSDRWVEMSFSNN